MKVPSTHGAIARLGPGWRLPTIIALLGAVLNIVVATSMAPTTDEATHVSYGGEILKRSPDRSRNIYFDSKMPITALNALPRAISRVLQPKNIAAGLTNELADFRATRYATILAAFALSILVYVYAKLLYGRTAGLFAQALLLVSPNIIAHSTLATTDLYIASATLLFLFCLQGFIHAPGFRSAFQVAIVLALAQVIKFLALYLYLVLVACIAFAILYSRYSNGKDYNVTPHHAVSLLALHIVCFIIVVNVSFVFDRTFTPLSDYRFSSRTFKAAQQIPVLSAIPLPLPYAYLQGLDMMSDHNVTGESFGNIVLLSEVRGPRLARSDGFPAYYLIAYLFKEPIGLQLIFILSLWLTVRRRRLVALLRGELPLLITAGVILLMLSFFSRTQIGIRHILPVLVIFTVISGGIFAEDLKLSFTQKTLVAACMVWALVSVGSYFPNMIPYFNEFVMDRKMAYSVLADSNLDWGQDKWTVEAFLKQNPDVSLDPPTPVTGRVLIGANSLAGVVPVTADHWLRKSALRPVSQVGYAHLLFVVPARE